MQNSHIWSWCVLQIQVLRREEENGQKLSNFKKKNLALYNIQEIQYILYSPDVYSVYGLCKCHLFSLI